VGEAAQLRQAAAEDQDAEQQQDRQKLNAAAAKTRW
jgi:hypothetical protein